MIIEVKIFSSLSHYIPNSDRCLNGDKWDISEGATVAQVLEMLNLPEEEALILIINGHHVDRDRVLNEGDVLHVMPQIAGG
jgi:sulfur carrier protein ThiS